MLPRNEQLLVRLRNCLQTILELEEALVRSPLGPALQEEFFLLRQMSKQLDEISVVEADVCRIEAATDRFLAEIKEPLELDRQGMESPLRILQ